MWRPSIRTIYCGQPVKRTVMITSYLIARNSMSYPVFFGTSPSKQMDVVWSTKCRVIWKSKSSGSESEENDWFTKDSESILALSIGIFGLIFRFGFSGGVIGYSIVSRPKFYFLNPCIFKAIWILPSVLGPRRVRKTISYHWSFSIRPTVKR